MVPSGIPPMDLRVGGAVLGRLHLMSGGPGTGKSTAGLQFLREGLRLGETVVMLTADRTGDLVSHAAHLGMDLEPPLRSGKLMVLRYRPSFAALLQHSAVPEQMLDDLRRLLLPVKPARVLVDTLLPLMAAAPHADATVAALADFFDGMESTTLMTFSGDLTAGRGAGYDFRLEPLVERAAAVFHLTRQVDAAPAWNGRDTAPEACCQLHVVRVRRPVRSTAPASYSIQAGVGIVMAPALGAGAGFSEPLARPPVPSAAENAHVPYAVVTLMPTGPRSEHTLPELLATATRHMRASAGDLATIIDDRVQVYLHGAPSAAAALYAQRVLAQWSVTRREAIDVASFGYPSDETRLRALVAQHAPASDADTTMNRAGRPQ